MSNNSSCSWDENNGLVPDHSAGNTSSSDDASTSGTSGTSDTTGTTYRDTLQNCGLLNRTALQHDLEHDWREPSEHSCGVYSVRLSGSCSCASDSEPVEHSFGDNSDTEHVHGSPPGLPMVVVMLLVPRGSEHIQGPDSEHAQRLQSLVADSEVRPLLCDLASSDMDPWAPGAEEFAQTGTWPAAVAAAIPTPAAAATMQAINDPGHYPASTIQAIHHDPAGPHNHHPAPSSPSSASSSATLAFGRDSVKKRRLQ